MHLNFYLIYIVIELGIRSHWKTRKEWQEEKLAQIRTDNGYKNETRLVSVLIKRLTAESVGHVVFVWNVSSTGSFVCFDSIVFNPFFCADSKFCLYNYHIRLVVLSTFDLEIPSVELTSSNAWNIERRRFHFVLSNRNTNKSQHSPFQIMPKRHGTFHPHLFHLHYAINISGQ